MAGEPQLTARLFVSAANTNNVYAVAVTDAASCACSKPSTCPLTPRQPLGMTPSALALSADRNGCTWSVPMPMRRRSVDITGARSHVLGFIPTGWYPTAAPALPDGRAGGPERQGLAQLSESQGAESDLSTRARSRGAPADQYVGRIQTGSASFIAPITEQQLRSYHGRGDGEFALQRREAGQPDPLALLRSEHVIYIVKENRTYDQVLGDIGKGKSDPSLMLFGEKVTSQSSQAGARVRAARQLLRERRRERGRAQLVHRRDRATITS